MQFAAARDLHRILVVGFANAQRHVAIGLAQQAVAKATAGYHVVQTVANAAQGNDARCFMGLANQDPGFITSAGAAAASRCAFSGSPTPAQFGNARSTAYMKAYTPYENVREGVTYPRILAVTSLNDTRVMYVEPAKWVARLREVGADALLKCEMSAGHGGVSGRYNSWRERAYELAWIFDVLGVADA